MSQNTPMLPIGTRVALNGTIIAALNAHLEDAYRCYNVRLPDGQMVNTNVRNTLSLEAHAEAEQKARQAETDAFQETLNSLLEEKEAAHQAEIEQFRTEQDTLREALLSHNAQLQEERGTALAEAEALRAEKVQAATVEAALRAEISVLKKELEKAKKTKPAPAPEMTTTEDALR